MSEQEYPVTNIPSFIEGLRLVSNFAQGQRDALLTEIEEGNLRRNLIVDKELDTYDAVISFAEDQIKKYKALKPNTKKKIN